MKKKIQIFSDGTINFSFNGFVNFQKLKVFEKDHTNSFSKKKIDNSKNSDYSSKYKNKYLF